MAGWVNGGMGVPTAAGATTLTMNSTGFDRLLLIHYSAVSANTIVNWKLGSALVALTTTLALGANSVYDFGPFFFGSSESLIGGLGTSSGSYVIDEMRLP